MNQSNMNNNLPAAGNPAGAAAAEIPDDPILNNIRNRLANTYQGTQNVPTLYSNIDILTTNEIIVIKNIHNWAEGIGLLYAHSSQFPNKQKHLHLYNTNINNRNNQDLLNKIMSLTMQLMITLTVEN